MWAQGPEIGECHNHIAIYNQIPLSLHFIRDLLGAPFYERAAWISLTRFLFEIIKNILLSIRYYVSPDLLNRDLSGFEEIRKFPSLNPV